VKRIRIVRSKRARGSLALPQEEPGILHKDIRAASCLPFKIDLGADY